jgi:hypothetical protein
MTKTLLRHSTVPCWRVWLLYPAEPGKPQLLAEPLDAGRFVALLARNLEELGRARP